MRLAADLHASGDKTKAVKAREDSHVDGHRNERSEVPCNWAIIAAMIITYCHYLVRTQPAISPTRCVFP
jgi:hypothetical protein